MMSTPEPTTAQMAVYRTVVEIIESHRSAGRHPAYALQSEVVERVIHLAARANDQSSAPNMTLTGQDVVDILDRLVMDELLDTGPTVNDRYFRLHGHDDADFRSKSESANFNH